MLFLLPVATFAQPAPTPGSPPSATPPAPQAAPEEAARQLAAKQEELTTVTRQISELQQKAEKDENVQAAKDDYAEVLRSEMLKVAPNLESAIDRQKELVNELSAPAPAAEKAEKSTAEQQKKKAEDQQAKLTEYRTLYQKLAPVEKQVQNVPAVETARTDLLQQVAGRDAADRPEGRSVTRQASRTAFDHPRIVGAGQFGLNRGRPAFARTVGPPGPPSCCVVGPRRGLATHASDGFIPKARPDVDRERDGTRRCGHAENGTAPFAYAMPMRLRLR